MQPNVLWACGWMFIAVQDCDFFFSRHQQQAEKQEMKKKKQKNEDTATKNDIAKCKLSVTFKIGRY